MEPTIIAGDRVRIKDSDVGRAVKISLRLADVPYYDVEDIDGEWAWLIAAPNEHGIQEHDEVPLIALEIYQDFSSVQIDDVIEVIMDNNERKLCEVSFTTEEGHAYMESLTGYMDINTGLVYYDRRDDPYIMGTGCRIVPPQELTFEVTLRGHIHEDFDNMGLRFYLISKANPNHVYSILYEDMQAKQVDKIKINLKQQMRAKYQSIK